MDFGDGDQCKGVNCGEHAKCIDRLLGYECICEDGYFLVDGYCHLEYYTDLCQFPGVCPANSKCHTYSLKDDFACICDDGFFETESGCEAPISHTFSNGDTKRFASSPEKMSFFAAKVFCKNFGEEMARISGNRYKPWNFACPENMEENEWLTNFPQLIERGEVFLGMSAKPKGWYRFDGKGSEFMNMRRIFPTTDYRITIDGKGEWRPYTSAEIDQAFVICEESTKDNFSLFQSKEIFYLEELPKVWTMKFEMHLDRPRKQSSVENGANILYVTNALSSDRLGIPAIFMDDKKSLKFCYADNCITTDQFQIEELFSVELFTDFKGYFGVILDNDLLEVIPVDLKTTRNITGFASAPWYRQHHGWINNMEVTPDGNSSIVISEKNSELQTHMNNYCNKICSANYRYARSVSKSWECYPEVVTERLGNYCVDKGGVCMLIHSIISYCTRYEPGNL